MQKNPDLTGDKKSKAASGTMATLRDMVDLIERCFSSQGRSARERGDAEAVVSVLSDRFGGAAIYLPRGDRLRKALRNIRICSESDGRNMEELSQRYRLSEKALRRILKDGQRPDSGD